MLTANRLESNEVWFERIPADFCRYVEAGFGIASRIGKEMTMSNLSRSRPIDRWERSPHPERRCTAHRKNGDQCKNAARRGTNVCDFHGAKAPQVKRKARQRIEEAADRMARELLKMATDDDVAASVKLAAIRDALDRAGLAANSAVEVEVGPPKPYEAILERIEVGSRAEYRRSRGIPDGGEGKRALAGSQPELAAPIEAEVLDDPSDGADIATNMSTLRGGST